MARAEVEEVESDVVEVRIFFFPQLSYTCKAPPIRESLYAIRLIVLRIDTVRYSGLIEGQLCRLLLAVALPHPDSLLTSIYWRRDLHLLIQEFGQDTSLVATKSLINVGQMHLRAGG